MGRRKKKGSSKFKEACRRTIEKGKKTGFYEGCVKRYPEMLDEKKGKKK
jgi:hypothetical protein